MPVPRRSLQGEWSSHGVFILALAGASIGFGNLWRFPSLLAEHGGGTFIVLYLGCLVLFGLPLLLAELLVGSSARQAPVQAYASLARLHAITPRWWLGGALALAGAGLLLAVLSVVAGWSLGYLFRALGGAVEQLDVVDATILFQGVARDPERALAWQTVFLVLAAAVVAPGLRRGIERFIRFAVPLLLGALGLLLIYAVQRPEFTTVAPAVWAFDLAHLNSAALFAALRQCFYSLALGVGVASVYGAYLPQRAPLASSALLVIALDTLVALAGSLVVLTLLAAGDMGLRSGPGLMFEVLPMAVSQLAEASYVAVLLYALMVLAALTTAVGLLEAMVAWLVERGSLRRPQATALAAGLAWGLGLSGVLSYSVFHGWYPLAMLPGLESASVFSLLNQFGTLVLLPLASLAAVVFIGWAIPRESMLFGLGWSGGRLFDLWYLVFRYIVPVLLALVLADGLGLFPGANG